MVIIDKGETTYIQISKEVAGRLNQIKLVPRESYEDVLRRLLKMSKRIVKQKNERGLLNNGRKQRT